MPAMAALLRRFLSASEPQPCVSGRALKTSGTKLDAQYRRSYALFKLLFSFFDGIGPVDRFGGLVVIGNVFSKSGFQSVCGNTMIGPQTCALE